MRRLVCGVLLAAAALVVVTVQAPESAADTAAGAGAYTPADMTDADRAKAAESRTELLGDIVFTPPSGTFATAQSVALSTSVAGAQLRYTTDGTLPNASSPVYSAPIALTRTTQVRAQAYVNGAASGAPGTALYVARGSVGTSHDLPLLVLDAYGRGAPGRDYVDAAVLEIQPSGGSATLATAPAVATRAGIHLRGQSSATFPKAPYRLELRGNDDDDADYPLGGMPADSDWVLRGPYPDKTLIHDAFAYGLARDMGLQAPRFAFFEVYLNTDAQPMAANDYMGVYLLTETIKNSKNRLNLKQLDEDDVDPAKITGGYIWKFDWMAAEEPILPCAGNDTTCWHYLEVDDPDPLNATQRTWLTQHLQQFHDMLRSPGFADPATGYPAYIDVGSFIDRTILNELGREMDAYVRSAYFYKDRGGKITAGPVWDYDLSFNTGGFFNNQSTSGWQYQQTRSPSANDWHQRLLQDPSYVDQVRRRWQSLRQGLLSPTALNQRVATLTARLANAAQRNFQRWPILTQAQVGFFVTPTAATWQGQLTVMRDWMAQRAAWLDSAAGWGGTVSPAPSSPGPSSPRPSSAGPSSAAPSSASPSVPAGRACTATYTARGQWPGGFQGEVRVAAGTVAIGGWTVTMTFRNGQTVTQIWEASATSSGATVTARNLSHNGAVAAGSSTTFGFLGAWNGTTNDPPTLTCAAT
ncbi:hypothetical protein Val02_28810 [Virgisporangium aliadipatigenens]|uniref:CBM2 domain-containing protein n=1 Tax=Virgisporangium aliadipatigenens TaxID=741659 RepID=A0A8J3YL68_9ACTN|nr:CotH kinase family protein [Virgisporangium aliadipatigenens]GIJ45995.1 hypothetical protein Val02_28810 [Virgisporangium aliadipatigenens]